MKKTIWMIAAILTLSGLSALTLTSCTDSKDNPADNPDQPSAVDQGKWTIDDSYMDLTVKPGDNFFMYCNGTWWNNTTVGTELITGYFRTTVAKDIMSKVDALDYATLQTLKSHIERIDETKEAATAIMQEGKALLESSKTLEEAWFNTGKLMAAGYATPFKLMSFSVKGHMALMIIYNSELDFPIPKEYNSAATGADMASMLHKQPAKILPYLTPIHAKATTRGLGTEWPMFTKICEGAGIDPDQVYMYDAYAATASPDFPADNLERLMQAMHLIQNLELKDYIEGCMEMLTSDAVLQSAKDWDDYNAKQLAILQTTLEKAIKSFRDNNMKYEDSYHFVKNYVTDKERQQCKTIIKEFQEAFKKRINENDWMSDATKRNVVDKLDNMTLNVGYPDTWFDEGLADLSQSSSLLEDVLLLRKAKFNLQRKLCGMKTAEASFHALIAENDALTEINAYYNPNYNSMNILPVWIMKPAYDTEQSDAINYGSYAIVAHEITHGFDSDGAKFDKYGDIGSIWASEADAAEFQRRTQMLVEWYNTFEVMPDELPGIYNDGAFTLAENTADLGGFEIAYRAYLDKIKAEGFKGDELNKQLVKFYRSYANLWRAKYVSIYAKQATIGDSGLAMILGVDKDVHSLERERVNGIVPNTEAWYDLFDVKPGDKLYLAPDKRIHIW